MIVLDASAAIALLLGGPLAEALADRIFDPDAVVNAPHLLDLEVAQVLRRVEATGHAESDRIERALDLYDRMLIERHGHASLLPRIWALRKNLTAYDAAYVALAESLDATLLTCDQRMAATAGKHVRVEVPRST